MKRRTLLQLKVSDEGRSVEVCPDSLSSETVLKESPELVGFIRSVVDHVHAHYLGCKADKDFFRMLPRLFEHYLNRPEYPWEFECRVTGFRPRI